MLKNLLKLTFVAYITFFSVSPLNGEHLSQSDSFSESLNKLKIYNKEVYTPYPSWVVADCKSAENQSKDDFIKEVALSALEITQKTGFEVCGVFAEQGNEYSIVLTTNKSQLECIYSDDAVLTFYQKNGEQIHTHPYTDEFNYLVVKKETEDYALSRGIKHLHEGDELILKSKEDFSTKDIESGGGYLASNDKLFLYSKADNSKRLVATLNMEYKEHNNNEIDKVCYIHDLND